MIKKISNFSLWTKFQSVTKKIPMEIVGESGIAPNKIFLVAERHRLLEAGYEGIKVSEKDLEEKLKNKQIEII